ncbi:MAG: helicase-related protein [Candidatus Sericytochromatia bacterium]|nr:helicase-related protein [Candidatus Sericytochromatia bacterium]
MNQDVLWQRIAANEQKVAEAEALVRPGHLYQLTEAQTKAIADLDQAFRDGAVAALLHAPTGAGKTAVEFHLLVRESLRQRAAVIILTPTRDLLRQHLHYIRSRLEGTPLRVDALHGGVAPAAREDIVGRFDRGLLSVLVASGLMLQEESYRQRLRKAAFLVVDDVHAFDAQTHLRWLTGVQTPTLFATATPAPLDNFLREKGVGERIVALPAKPFQTPTTRQYVFQGRYGDDPTHQVLLAESRLRDHLQRQGRIYIVSRTREQVPRIARFLERRLGVTVLQLHGDLLDTAEQAKRLNRYKNFRPETTRVAVMTAFRETMPAILVTTNLIGAGTDVPEADLIIITDADGFGEAEVEQLIGRVGRREKPSEACLIRGTMGRPSLKGHRHRRKGRH